MSTMTQYADNYLSGYNDVPVGVLDNPEFQAEVRRLSGPAPTQKQVEALRAVRIKQIARFEKALNALRGPRGGIPTEGRQTFLRNVRLLNAMKESLV